MKELMQIIDLCQERDLPFYLECNDFISGGIDLNEEIEELLDDDDIDEECAVRCRRNNCVWSARVHLYPGDVVIAYESNWIQAIEELHCALIEKGLIQ